MKKLILSIVLLLFLSAIVQAVEVRVRPHRLNPNGKKPRMKVEIRDVDTSAVDLASITLNGISPIKTRGTPKKVIAFYYKSDVIATLGEIKKGDVHVLNISFNVGLEASNLTDEITIVGKKKKHSDTPEGAD
jgi:hypothetical protein